MIDLTGRTVLITGANTGIGRATALSLAARGATLFLACRSQDKTRAVMDEVRAAGNDRSTSVISRRSARARRRSCPSRIAPCTYCSTTRASPDTRG